MKMRKSKSKIKYIFYDINRIHKVNINQYKLNKIFIILGFYRAKFFNITLSSFSRRLNITISSLMGIMSSFFII